MTYTVAKRNRLLGKSNFKTKDWRIELDEVDEVDETWQIPRKWRRLRQTEIIRRRRRSNHLDQFAAELRAG